MTSINVISMKQVREREVPYKLDQADVNSPDKCYDLIERVFSLSEEPVEKFGIICLNTKLKVTGMHILAVGGLNEARVGVREVFQAALMNNSYAIILFHNHPSGDTRPSAADADLTEKMVEAGKLLGVRVLDHIIVGYDGFTSFANEGRM